MCDECKFEMVGADRFKFICIKFQFTLIGVKLLFCAMRYLNLPLKMIIKFDSRVIEFGHMQQYDGIEECDLLQGNNTFT